MLLSDGYLANGSEPWRIPDVDSLPEIDLDLRDRANHTRRTGPGEFWPYLRDEETLARPWAIPGHARPGAPHRRDREGRRPRQHLLRPGQPRLHGPHPGGQGRPHRPSPAPARGRRPDRRRRRCSCSAGGRRTGPIGAGLPPGPHAGLARRPGAPAPPQPVPAQPRRDPARLRQGAGPGDEPRPARHADPGEISRRRHQLQPGPRPAVPSRRARRVPNWSQEGDRADV